MSNLRVETVEYTKERCENTKNLMCPYCSMEHDLPEGYHTVPINLTDYPELYHCWNCESYSVYETTPETLRFNSQPIENYYLSEKEKLTNDYKKTDSQSAKAKEIALALENLEVLKNTIMQNQLQNRRS